ncbi:hypothetical protein C2857_006768 [Epichloe festucae Fl1]|uniref:Uncharacterized protein n=1 Tax=Epichloe festucae (strain Fl1) TaxID=877507 RepID=A0A7S9KQ76_EPIFF|nr:hypothetical protein C2857_006768 [Epichloe festucae Fl1]
MLTNGTSSRAAGLTLASRRAARTGQVLTPSAAALLRSRHRQCRTFWLGSWARDCDGDARHHARRRRRAHRHQCMESLNRKLSWENKPRHDAVRAAVKTAFAHIAHGPTGTTASKYVDIKDIKSWSDELSGGVRPGRNTEDVEREAIDHLFNTNKQNKCHQSAAHWSPLSNIRKYLRRKESEQVTASDFLHATTSAEDTKVTKSTAPAGQFTPKKSELEKYHAEKLDNPNAPQKLTPEEASKKYDDLDKYKPVEWNEPDGLLKLTPEEKSKQYKDLGKYASPDISRDVAAVESSKPAHNDLQKYKPLEWNEPDGLREQTPEELSKNYDDLHKYGPVTWNEPDGLRPLTPEELSKNYDDLDKYGPVKWNEPDGLQKPTSEELSKQYDDLDAYGKPYVAQDSVLKAHAAAQQDPTPRAEPIAAKVDAIVADPAEACNDLDKYGPVKWNEPDGLRKLTPEELSKNYEDLHLYAQYPNAGPAHPRIHPEEASKQYSDLRKYDAFPNAGPAEERVHPELASKQYKDLHRYPSAGYEEPSKTRHVHPEELTKDYQDLHKYQPQSFDFFDKKYPMHPEEASKAYNDLGSYKSVLHNEPDGKSMEKVDPVASSLRAFDGFKNDKEPQTAAEIRSDVLRRAHQNSKRTMVQKAKVQQKQGQRASAEGAETTSNQPALTGNYTNDSPEEFATSWDVSHAWSKSTLLPKHHAETGQSSEPSRALGCEKGEADISSMDESFPSEVSNKTSMLQSALDRNSGEKPLLSAMNRLERMKLAEDPYSKSPRGLELSYMDECAGSMPWPTFVRHHKGRRGEEAPDAGSGAEPTPEQQPVLYKMLAYDASTQSISVAETCSGVHDTSTPATPAEVLLRVSNPSKFFPYFSALQAEGYEIASGSGDVLVFRKVRRGTAFKDASESTINPVDVMMGRSGASNFASPTGHVNYESPQYRPVHAGQSQGVKVGRKKRSLGRKVVIGTAWFAGTAYAVSVAGEYLSTGGKAL